MRIRAALNARAYGLFFHVGCGGYALLAYGAQVLWIGGDNVVESSRMTSIFYRTFL